MNKIPYKEFKKIYSKVPRLCVDIIIKNKNGILLTKRDIEPYKGKWHIPGGTILMGESLKATAQRCAREELGVEVTIDKQLGIIEYDEAAHGGFGYCFAIAFLCHTLEEPVGGHFFKKLPPRIIREQKEFIINNKII